MSAVGFAVVDCHGAFELFLSTNGILSYKDHIKMHPKKEHMPVSCRDFEIGGQHRASVAEQSVNSGRPQSPGAKRASAHMQDGPWEGGG